MLVLFDDGDDDDDDDDDDIISSSQANDFTDYPLTPPTPKPKSKTVLSDSQSASSGLEMFLSKKPTRLQPVFGTGRLHKS